MWILSLFFLILFLMFVLFPMRRLKIEKDAELLYEERCGGRFDGVPYGTPLVRHSIYKNVVVVAYAGRIICINKKDIIKASIETMFFSEVLVYHFWQDHKLIIISIGLNSSKKEKVKSILKQEGFIKN